MATFTTEFPVRFSDEDHARIVYFPRFFHFFHMAFEDFFGANGMPYRDVLDGDKLGWPAVHAEADFEKPVRFGDRLKIEMSVTKIGGTSVSFAYHASCAGESVAKGRVTVVCVDMDTLQKRDIPEKYRALFASISAG